VDVEMLSEDGFDKKSYKTDIYIKFMKRTMDIVLALLAIIVLSPVLLIVNWLVRVKLGSPRIFKQTRIGLNEKTFTLYKFRTMTDKREDNGELLSDEARLTKFGKMLRKTSVDELPELFNVLKGDMSIVGPRPLLLRYLPFFREEERVRSIVRPGITGLAQIRGRNSLGWDERFQSDILYVKQLSFLLDIKIIVRTIFVVFKREDILVGSEHVLKDLDDERQGEFSTPVEDKPRKKPVEIRFISIEELIRNHTSIIELLKDNLLINFPYVKEDIKELDALAKVGYNKMLRFQQDGSAILLGAFEEGKIIGFLWAYPSEVLGEKRLHIVHFIVNSSARSEGIGTKLLSLLENIASEKEIKKFELMATVENVNTMKFYKSKGFVTVRVQLEKELR
jgi:lipopolysaccharide/colanic/teichoic acid biosynthesis glycosyltransferase/ribosomal protein S18 acetylase RimI-like enzyme